jgi:hypothetical protein
MLDIINDVAALVSMLDPGIDIRSVTVTVASDTSDPGHQHHTLIPAEEFDELFENFADTVMVSEHSLTDLAEMEICSNNHSWKVSKESIPYALTDQKLGGALEELMALGAITPAENDPAKIVANLGDIDDLNDLAIEYIEYEDTILRELNENVRPDRSDHYDAVLRAQAQRIFTDLNYIRSSTLGSERAMSLLSTFANDTFQIPRDETPVFVALGSKVRHSREEADHEQVATALWVGLFGTDDLHVRSIDVMPRWAASLFAAIHPDFVRSTPRELGTVDDVVFDTAKRLWIESDEWVGVYANFDDALQAAKHLTV